MSFGCCCRRCLSVTLPSYQNITEVENYITIGSPPATILPYPRGDNSFPYNSFYCGDAERKQCGPWPEDDRPTEAEIGDELFQQNILHPTETNVTLERCKEWHKVVQSIKNWHGRNGFLNNQPCSEESCPAEETRFRKIKRQFSGSGFYLSTGTYHNVYNIDPVPENPPYTEEFESTLVTTYSINTILSKEYEVGRNDGVISNLTCIESMESSLDRVWGAPHNRRVLTERKILGRTGEIISKEWIDGSLIGEYRTNLGATEVYFYSDDSGIFQFLSWNVTSLASLYTTNCSGIIPYAQGETLYYHVMPRSEILDTSIDTSQAAPFYVLLVIPSYGYGQTIDSSNSGLEITNTGISWDVGVQMSMDYTIDSLSNPPPYFSGTYLAETGTCSVNIAIDIELSEEYSEEMLRSDCTGLIVNWALNNNSYFPWREDGFRALGTRVSNLERPATSPDISLFFGNANCSVDDYENPTSGENLILPFLEGWTPTWEKRPWFDTSAYTWLFPSEGGTQYTEAATGLRLNYHNNGGVKGTPFTDGWPDLVFDWDHLTYRIPLGYSIPQIEYYGAYPGTGAYANEEITTNDSTDTLIPESASQWTDNYTAALLPAGSFEIFDKNGLTEQSLTNRGDCLIMQKHVEGIVGFDRHNFFRPCGADRWMMDTSKASCIYVAELIFYETQVLSLVTDLTPYITTNDFVAIYSVFAGPKIFEVAAIGTNSITLGPEVANPEGISDTYSHWDEVYLQNDVVNQNPYSAVIGKLRWPDSDNYLKGEICGKINIANSVNQDGHLIVNLQTPANYLRTGDKIIFCDNDINDTPLDTNGVFGHYVIVVNPTQIKIAGLTYNSNNHTKCIKSLGALLTLAKWNTTQARKDYITMLWPTNVLNGNFVTEVNEAIVSDGNYTDKLALACTPNSDFDVNWINASMPECITTYCGGEAALIFVQRVVDPLYQVPIACSVNLSVCPPYVEPMTNYKIQNIEAPPLPLGTSFESVFPSGAHLPAGFNSEANAPNQHDAPWFPCA